MSQTAITIGGFGLPSNAPPFLVVLAIHVVAGFVCVISGIIAMLSLKGPGQHPRFATIYYRGLWVVFITMAVLSGMRWAQDYHLFILGTLSLAAAVVGRQAAPSRTRGRIRAHVTAMGSSYVLLLTAFYVDNGKNLPIWRSLPPIAYWLIPAMVGVPLIIRVLRRHPVVQAEHRTFGSEHAV